MSQVTLELTETSTSIEVDETNAAVNVTETFTTLDLGNAGPQGATGEQGPSGLSSSFVNYKIKTTSTSGDPGNTHIIYNNATQTSATQINISHLDKDNEDVNLLLHLLNQGDYIIIQDKDASANFQKYLLTSNHTSFSTYDTFAVSLDSSGGTGTTNFANNHNVILVMIRVGAVGPTGPQGPSGVIAVTSPITNSGTSTSATIGINQGSLILAQSQVTDLVTDLTAKANTTTLTGVNNQSTSVVDTISRAIGYANIAATAGTLYFVFFTPSQNVTATQVSMASNTTGSSGLTLARMGLYTFDGTTATLVARTASDTTLFNSGSTLYTRSFDTTGGYPSSYTLTAGTRYALGVIQVGSQAASFAGVTGNTLITNLAPRTIGSVASQTDLLTSRNTFTAASQLLWGRFS